MTASGNWFTFTTGRDPYDQAADTLHFRALITIPSSIRTNGPGAPTVNTGALEFTFTNATNANAAWGLSFMWQVTISYNYVQGFPPGIHDTKFTVTTNTGGSNQSFDAYMDLLAEAKLDTPLELLGPSTKQQGLCPPHLMAVRYPLFPVIIWYRATWMTSRLYLIRLSYTTACSTPHNLVAFR